MLLGLRDAAMAGPGQAGPLPAWATNKLGGTAVRPGRAEAKQSGAGPGRAGLGGPAGAPGVGRAAGPGRA